MGISALFRPTFAPCCVLCIINCRVFLRCRIVSGGILALRHVLSRVGLRRFPSDIHLARDCLLRPRVFSGGIPRLVEEGLSGSFGSHGLQVKPWLLGHYRAFFVHVTMGNFVSSFLPITSARRQHLGGMCVTFLSRVERRLGGRDRRRRAGVRAIRVHVNYCGRLVVAWPIRSVFGVRDNLRRVRLFVFMRGLFHRSRQIRELAPRARCHLHVSVPTLYGKATY